MLGRILSFFEKIMTAITWIALLTMMTLVTVDVIGRYFRTHTFPDVYHFTELYLMPIVVFFALASTQADRGHVSVNLVSAYFPKAIQHLILAFVFIAAGSIFVLITWVSFNNAWGHLINWRVTGGVVPWPTGLSRIIVPIGAGVLSIRLFSDAIHEGLQAIGRTQTAVEKA